MLLKIQQTAGAHTLVSGPERLTTGDHIKLSFLWFSLNFHFAALLPIVIPAQILLFVAPGTAGNANQAVLLGALAAVGALVTLILQPLVGTLSDRTSTRLGRRRPYVIGGAALMLIGLSVLALTRNLIFFIVGLTLVVIANTISGTAYQGLVPDRVPKEQRGAASGYMGLMTILGTVGSLAVASLFLSQSSTGRIVTAGIAHGASLFYGVAALVVVIGVLVTLLGVREVPFPHLHLPHFHAQTAHSSTSLPASRKQRMARLWVEPLRHHNFRWVFLTRGFVMLGLALFMTFIEYYFAQVAHVTNFVQATAINAVMALLGAVGSTLLLGIISDRTRRVPVVFVATSFMALAALTFVIAPGSIPLWPLGILFGLGYGAFTSVDWALAMDALPSLSSSGKDLGLWSTASTLPAILAPVVGSAVVFIAAQFGATAWGYRSVFALATLFLALGAFFVLKVRETRHSIEPEVVTA